MSLTASATTTISKTAVNSSVTSSSTTNNNNNNNSNGTKRYQLSLSANHLPKQLFRCPSTYVKVTVAGGPLDGQMIGYTSVILRSCHPDWTDTLFLDTASSIYMPLKMELWRDCSGGHNTASSNRDSDVLLGEVTMEATEIFNSLGRSKTESLSCGGTVTAVLEESIKGSTFGRVKLQLRGLDLKNVEPGPFGLGRTDPMFELAKKNMDPSSGVVRWNVVYRSEHINNNLNPYWEPFQLTLEELCYGDLDWPLRITVCDWNGVASTRRLGYFETTLKGLHQQISFRGNADRERAFDLDTEDKGTNLGLICVVACQLQSYEGEEILIEQNMKDSLTSTSKEYFL